MGDTGEVARVNPVSGGCINQVVQIESRQNSYLLKWNHRPLSGMFAAEAAGLHLLKTTKSIRVPEVLSIGENSGGINYILLEWIEPEQQKVRLDQALLGSQLASLHRQLSPQGMFGLDHDNYIGSNRQFNGWKADWIEFFRDKRLQPQIEMAVQQGLVTGNRLTKLRYVANNLNIWLSSEKTIPSLVHGDLWAGNIISGTQCEPVLIDPAVYFGDREVDLAFTELFGGFSVDFYKAYQETWPLEDSYPKRRDIYNLYHLLNHLNLFGSSYGYQIDSILERYTPKSSWPMIFE